MIRIFEEDFGYGYRPELHQDVDDLEGVYMRNPRHALFVAADDLTGEIIGTAGVRAGRLKPALSPDFLVQRYESDSVAQLVRVYVLHEHRRRGAARALVQATLDFIAADGHYNLISLHTHPFSPGAMDFWRAMGTTTVYEPADGQEVFFEMAIPRN
jgi:GNAT superfamily N-acetyltransferase